MSRSIPGSSLILFVAAAVVAAACSRTDPKDVTQHHVEAGNARYAQGKYREALIEYRRAIQLDPNFGAAHRGAAEAYTALDDPENALTAYVRAADLSPADDQLQLEAANLLLYAGRFQDAEGRVRGVLRRHPQHARALLLLGSALAGMKRIDAAFDAQQQALTLDPLNAGAHVKMGALQFLRGNHEEARAALQQAAAIDGDSAAIQIALASYYWAVNQADQAEASIHRALTLEPNNVLATAALATVYLDTNRSADAEPLLKKVVSLAGDSNSRISSRIALATYYLQQRRHADAAAALTPLLSDRVAFPIAKTRLAIVADDAGQPEVAAGHLRDALRREPRYVPALSLMTHLLLKKGSRNEALASAARAVDIDPRSAMGQFALGRAHRANANASQARDAFLKVIELDPRSTDAYLELSRIRLAQGEPETAVRRAATGVSLNPGSLEARLLLVRALIARPETAPRAKQQLQEIAAAYPTSPRPHLMRGTLALLEKDAAAARQSFDAAFQLDPASFEAVNGLVSLDLQETRLDSARRRLESFLQKAPRSAEALMLLAQVHAMRRDNAAAEQTLRRVIEVQPTKMEAYTALGSLYLAQRKVREARDEFIQVAAHQPRAVGPPTLVGILSQSLQDPAGAERWYKKALEIDGNAAVAANNLAWMYAEQGQHLDRAVQLATEAHAQLRGRPEASDTLGWASYKAELISTAIPLFHESIEANPANPTYHYHLGLAYMKQRDVEQARSSLQRALTLNPSFVNAADARAALASLD
jgi:putative PEP-CTERM system TPR-repeat lipoprotein